MIYKFIFCFICLSISINLLSQKVRVGNYSFDNPSVGQYRTLECAIENMRPGSDVILKTRKNFKGGLSINKPCKITVADEISGSILLGDVAEGKTINQNCSLRLFSDYYFHIYENDRWEKHLKKFEFEGIEKFYEWNDRINDKLSSLKFKVPEGWELRIYRDRDPNSPYILLDGTGKHDKDDLNNLIYSCPLCSINDQASGHMWVKQGGVFHAFEKIDEKDNREFEFSKDASLQLPNGFDYGKYHQQSIHKTANGDFVVTGSAKDGGYIYFANGNRKIVKIIRPESYGYVNSSGYDHLGGCQVVENILAVGYESLYGGEDGTSDVLFFDISDILNPKYLSHLTIRRKSSKSTAGAVGLLKLEYFWILVVANWNAERLDFYRSNSDELENIKTRFDYFLSWDKDEEFGKGHIGGGWKSYQNINMFSSTENQREMNNLWLIGMHTSSYPILSKDWGDLYYLEANRNQITLTKYEKKHFKGSGGTHFIWGGGFIFNVDTDKFEVYSIDVYSGVSDPLVPVV
jgi:hypothetical protein